MKKVTKRTLTLYCDREQKKEKVIIQTNWHNTVVAPSDVRIEYWMIYRGAGFLAIVWFGSKHTPPPVCSTATHRKFENERQAADGRGGWAWWRVIRPQESLAIFKSFNNLWVCKYWNWKLAAKVCTKRGSSEEIGSIILHYEDWGMLSTCD